MFEGNGLGYDRGSDPSAVWVEGGDWPLSMTDTDCDNQKVAASTSVPVNQPVTIRYTQSAPAGGATYEWQGTIPGSVYHEAAVIDGITWGATETMFYGGQFGAAPVCKVDGVTVAATVGMGGTALIIAESELAGKVTAEVPFDLEVDNGTAVFTFRMSRPGVARRKGRKGKST